MNNRFSTLWIQTSPNQTKPNQTKTKPKPGSGYTALSKIWSPLIQPDREMRFIYDLPPLLLLSVSLLSSYRERDAIVQKEIGRVIKLLSTMNKRLMSQQTHQPQPISPQIKDTPSRVVAYQPCMNTSPTNLREVPCPCSRNHSIIRLC